MTDIKRDVIHKSLLAKGFKHKKGVSDHDKYCLYVDGKWYTQVFARISRGSGYKTYGEELLSRMRKALCLDKLQDVKDLLGCPMEKEQYLKILKEKKQLP